MEKWEIIHGKTINFMTDEGNKFEALVIADPKVGISIKPLDPEDVLQKEPHGWTISPSDPDFYFVCTRSTLAHGRKNFLRWVNILCENRDYFTESDIISPFAGTGSCPFA